MDSNLGRYGETSKLLPPQNKEFPISMEIIPRQQSFACLSLKFGCIVSGCILIVYSVLSLAQCTAIISDVSQNLSTDDMYSLVTFGLLIAVTIVHAITLFLTTIMLVGVLREKLRLMRPWVIWTSIQVMVYFLLFVFWTVMYMVNHSSGLQGVLVYFIEFMGLLVRFYMLVLVASYYKSVEDEKYEGERVKTLINNEVWYNSA